MREGIYSINVRLVGGIIARSDAICILTQILFTFGRRFIAAVAVVERPGVEIHGLLVGCGASGDGGRGLLSKPQPSGGV